MDARKDDNDCHEDDDDDDTRVRPMAMLSKDAWAKQIALPKKDKKKHNLQHLDVWLLAAISLGGARSRK